MVRIDKIQTRIWGGWRESQFCVGKKVRGDAALGLEILRGARLEVESMIWLRVLLYSSGSNEKKTALILHCEHSLCFLDFSSSYWEFHEFC